MNSRRLWLPLSAALAAGLGVSPAAAQAPAGDMGKVGVVDVIRIYDECDQIIDLNAILREENDKATKEAEARRKVLAQKEVELNAFSPDSPDYASRRDEFARLSIDANVWMQVMRQQLQREHFNWTRVVYEECTKAVSEIARERGFTVVLQRREFKPDAITDQNVDSLRQMIHGRSVVFADDSLDITEAVIKRMNQRYRDRGGKNKLNLGLRPAASP